MPNLDKLSQKNNKRNAQLKNDIIHN